MLVKYKADEATLKAATAALNTAAATEATNFTAENAKLTT
jgi:hypothetical protein